MLTIDQNNSISSKLPTSNRLFLFFGVLLQLPSDLATGNVGDRKSVDIISSKLDHLHRCGRRNSLQQQLDLLCFDASHARRILLKSHTNMISVMDNRYTSVSTVWTAMSVRICRHDVLW